MKESRSTRRKNNMHGLKSLMSLHGKTSSWFTQVKESISKRFQEERTASNDTEEKKKVCKISHPWMIIIMEYQSVQQDKKAYMTNIFLTLFVLQNIIQHQNINRLRRIKGIHDLYPSDFVYHTKIIQTYNIKRFRRIKRPMWLFPSDLVCSLKDSKTLEYQRT